MTGVHVADGVVVAVTYAVTDGHVERDIEMIWEDGGGPSDTVKAVSQATADMLRSELDLDPEEYGIDIV